MAGRPTGYAVSLAGYAQKLQTTAGNTAEHGRTDSKTAKHLNTSVRVFLVFTFIK